MDENNLNYIVKLGYDEVLVEVEGGENIYSLPGYNQGDYLHPGAVHTGEKFEHLFTVTKNEAEKHLGKKFPFKVHINKLWHGENHIIGASYNFTTTDIYQLNRYKKVSTVRNTVDYFISKEEKFIYPYYCLIPEFFDEDIPLPTQETILAAKNGLCRIVFFFGTEGLFDVNVHLPKLLEFINKVNCEVHLVHANLLLRTNIENTITNTPDLHKQELLRKINVYEYVGFELDPWFLNFDRTDTAETKSHSNNFLGYYDNHILTKGLLNKDCKKFLAFNRRPRIVRTALHTLIKSNPEVDKNTYSSLRYNPNIETQYQDVKFTLQKCKDSDAALNYLDNNLYLYKHKGFTVDADLDTNHASTFQVLLHYNTYVSVVTETLTHNDCIFFSEKIFKAVVACQPFILIGNPYSLESFRKLGYQTFGKWWDEEYDGIADEPERLSKIFEVIKTLNSKTNSELFDMYKDMKNTLEHNYKLFFENNRIYSYLDFLAK